MEFLAAFAALFMLVFTVKGFLFFALVFFAGYWARAYVAKKWPNEQAAFHALANKYGKDAEARMREYQKQLDARF